MKTNSEAWILRVLILGLISSVIAPVILITSPAYGQNYSWKQKANYGGGQVHDPFSFAIGSKAYVGTGISLQPTTSRNDFWEYDPATNIWTQKANFPGTARYGARGFAIGNFGYAGTGWDPGPKTDFYRYDPASNVWSAIPSFGGTGRYTSTTFTIDNAAYMGLGFSPCKNDFWKYDAITNSWSQIALFPGAARQTGSSFVISNFGYVGLGWCSNNVYSDFYQYNPFTNTWSAIASFPGGARSSAYSFSINNKGIIAMGCNYTDSNPAWTIFNDVWQYDPATGNWQQLANFPGERMFGGVYFGMNNKGYVGMGTDTTVFATRFSSKFWEYSPDTVSGIDDFISSTQFSIHPNPAATQVTITLEEPQWNNRFVTLDVLSAEGKLVVREKVKITGRKYVLDVTKLSAGNYLISVSDGKSSSTGRFVKAGIR
jgi:N-acetylneuraminic acid mutarotase